MRFHPAADQHVIGRASRAIDMQGKALDRAAHDRGFHVGTDRATNRCLGDAVGIQDLPLSFRGAPAVAAHGRHKKRFGPQSAEIVHGCPQDRRNVGDPAASGGDGDALPRLHAAVQFQAGQLRMDLAADIRHPRPGEGLTNTKYLGKVQHGSRRLLLGFT